MSKKRARNEENEGRKRIKVGDDELRDVRFFFAKASFRKNFSPLT